MTTATLSLAEITSLKNRKAALMQSLLHLDAWRTNPETDVEAAFSARRVREELAGISETLAAAGV